MKNSIKSTIKKAFFITLCITLLLSLSACGKNDVTKGSNDLSVHIGGNLKTIDPSLCTDSDGMTFILQCFEGLMTVNEQAEIVCGQAKQYHISENGLVYTFTLRDDLKWSDGKKLTAQDFVYSWRRLVDPKTASEYNYIIEMVKNANAIMAGEKDPSELGIVALSDTTRQIYLENRN